MGFDCNRTVVTLSADLVCPGILIGKLRQERTAESLRSVERLPMPVRVHSTHAGLVPAIDYGALFGDANCTLVDGIDFPPNVDLHYRVPPAARFSAMLAGGGDRDYEFVHRQRSLIDGTILVTHADHGAITSRDRQVLAEMAGCSQYRLVPWVPRAQYLRLLLSSRLLLLRVRGDAPADYTCIADAIWYGMPVLVNRSPGTGHLGGRVLLVEDQREVAEALRGLADPDHYAEVSCRVQASARARHDLFALLAKVYEAL